MRRPGLRRTNISTPIETNTTAYLAINIHGIIFCPLNLFQAFFRTKIKKEYFLMIRFPIYTNDPRFFFFTSTPTPKQNIIIFYGALLSKQFIWIPHAVYVKCIYTELCVCVYKNLEWFTHFVTIFRAVLSPIVPSAYIKFIFFLLS